MSQSQKSCPQSTSVNQQQQQRQQTPNEQQQQQVVAAATVAAASYLLSRQSASQMLQAVNPDALTTFLAANQAALGGAVRPNTFTSDAVAALTQHAQQRNISASQQQRQSAANVVSAIHCLLCFAFLGSKMKIFELLMFLMCAIVRPLFLNGATSSSMMSTWWARKMVVIPYDALRSHLAISISTVLINEHLSACSNKLMIH